jgi:hypothetical protein
LLSGEIVQEQKSAKKPVKTKGPSGEKGTGKRARRRRKRKKAQAQRKAAAVFAQMGGWEGKLPWRGETEESE